MREQIDFQDETVAVSGGASGIGKVIGQEFAKEGANVCIFDIDNESGQASVTEIENAFDTEAYFFETDISDYEQCTATISNALDATGQLDVLVNTAAITGAAISKPFLDEGPDDWKPQLQVTLEGTINMTHAALTEMTDRETGAIINFVSDSYQGQDPNFTIYGSMKAGIATFTKSVAKEVGEYGVRVNAVSPGTTRVPRSAEWLDEYHDQIVQEYPLDRLGEPLDHANATIFLASDAADWITGQILSVNGGYL